MWPWEHVAFGYLVYSATVHATARRPPGDRATFAVAAGALLPDLVDKPLSWSFHVFETGYGAAHSVIVVGPAAVALVALARRRGRLAVAAGYAVGHLSHLAGDLLYPLVRGGGLRLERVLWPVSHYPDADPEHGFLAVALWYVRRYAAQVLALDPDPVLIAEAVFLAVAFAVWLYDGAPVARGLWRAVVRRVD